MLGGRTREGPVERVGEQSWPAGEPRGSGGLRLQGQIQGPVGTAVLLWLDQDLALDTSSEAREKEYGASRLRANSN